MGKNHKYYTAWYPLHYLLPIHGEGVLVVWVGTVCLWGQNRHSGEGVLVVWVGASVLVGAEL